MSSCLLSAATVMYETERIKHAHDAHGAHGVLGAHGGRVAHGALVYWVSLVPRPPCPGFVTCSTKSGEKAW